MAAIVEKKRNRIKGKGFLLTALAAILCLVAISKTSHYDDEKTYHVQVIEKYIIPGGYKSSGHFEMVLKDLETGEYISRSVSSATFTRWDKGAYVDWTMKVRDVDGATGMDVLINVFLFALLGSISLVCFGAWIFCMVLA